MELGHEKVRRKIKTNHKSSFDTRTLNSKLDSKHEKAENITNGNRNATYFRSCILSDFWHPISYIIRLMPTHSMYYQKSNTRNLKPRF